MKIKALTKKQIAEQLLPIFKHHIGRYKSINSLNLYKTIYNEDYNSKKLESWLKKRMLTQALSYTRKYTKCFIVSEYSLDQMQYIYYVLKSEKEQERYSEKQYKKMDSADHIRIRSIQAYEEKWYKSKWKIP